MPLPDARRAATLAELPQPPSGKTGWPWTVESARLPVAMPTGRPWPGILIVTPSLNQGKYLEETIRSVLLQGYPTLEYILMDGGSTDGSQEIIQKYQPWISHAISQADQGQAQAINQGWQMSSGEIMAWINSDDVYCPGAFNAAAQALADGSAMVYSGFNRIDASSQVLERFPAEDFSLAKLLTATNSIPQPTVFLHGSVYESVGPLNEKLSYAFDLEYWLRIGLKIGPSGPGPAAIKHLSDGILACFRLHSGSKSSQQIEQFSREWVEIWDWFFSQPDIPPEISELKGQAYAYLYYQRALSNFRQRHLREAFEYLKKCSAADPAYLFIKPTRLLRLPVQIFRGIRSGKNYSGA